MTKGKWVPMHFDYAVIHFSDYKKYGCPRCGNFNCFTSASGGGTNIVTCSDQECGVGYAIVHDDLNRSTIGFGTENGGAEYPEVQKHPREGIPGHERTRRE